MKWATLPSLLKLITMHFPSEEGPCSLSSTDRGSSQKPFQVAGKGGGGKALQPDIPVSWGRLSLVETGQDGLRLESRLERVLRSREKNQSWPSAPLGPRCWKSSPPTSKT